MTDLLTERVEEVGRACVNAVNAAEALIGDLVEDLRSADSRIEHLETLLEGAE